MSEPVSRRALLVAGGALAVTAAGCGGSSTPGATVARSGATGELAMLRALVTHEQVQLAAYQQLLAAGGLDGQTAAWARQGVEVERAHVSAVGDLIGALGGRTPQVEVEPLPLTGAKGLAFLQSVEDGAAAAWRYALAHATSTELRAAAASLLAVELRQRTAAASVRGSELPLEPPRALAPRDALAPVRSYLQGA